MCCQRISPLYRNREVITSRKLGDFSLISETGAHYNGLVPVFLVVVENGLHALDTRVLLRGIVLLVGSLVPVENPAHKWRDEVGTSFSSGNGLRKRKHECQVAIDSVLAL